jgi:hypothetical protein
MQQLMHRILAMLSGENMPKNNLNRRWFIKSAIAAGGAGLWVPHVLLADNPLHRTIRKRKNVLLIL